jgi:hypothetical protein
MMMTVKNAVCPEASCKLVHRGETVRMAARRLMGDKHISKLFGESEMVCREDREFDRDGEKIQVDVPGSVTLDDAAAC